MEKIVLDNLYFDENTFLYTLCICILWRTKANNWGYIYITKSYLRLEQTKVWGRKIVYFSFCFTTFGSNSPGECTSNFWGLEWTPVEDWVEERLRVDVVSCCVFWGGSTGLSCFRRYIEDWELMWSAAVSFEVDEQDFPVSEDLLPRRRQDTDEVSLICWGVLQYAILLRRIICMNTGWVNPWLKLWWEGWRHRAHVQLQGTFRDVKWPESRGQGFGL